MARYIGWNIDRRRTAPPVHIEYTRLAAEMEREHGEGGGEIKETGGKNNLSIPTRAARIRPSETPSSAHLALVGGPLCSFDWNATKNKFGGGVPFWNRSLMHLSSLPPSFLLPLPSGPTRPYFYNFMTSFYQISRSSYRVSDLYGRICTCAFEIFRTMTLTPSAKDSRNTRIPLVHTSN